MGILTLQAFPQEGPGHLGERPIVLQVFHESPSSIIEGLKLTVFFCGPFQRRRVQSGAELAVENRGGFHPSVSIPVGRIPVRHEDIRPQQSLQFLSRQVVSDPGQTEPGRHTECPQSRSKEHTLVNAMAPLVFEGSDGGKGVQPEFDGKRVIADGVPNKAVPPLHLLPQIPCADRLFQLPQQKRIVGGEHCIRSEVSGRWHAMDIGQHPL